MLDSARNLHQQSSIITVSGTAASQVSYLEVADTKLFESNLLSKTPAMLKAPAMIKVQASNTKTTPDVNKLLAIAGRRSSEREYLVGGLEAYLRMFIGPDGAHNVT